MPLQRVNDRWTAGTHITFRFNRTSESGKTKIFDVSENTDITAILGHIQWFGRWRKYVFAPVSSCVFEQTCLREIAEFCETETRAHNHRRTSDSI